LSEAAKVIEAPGDLDRLFAALGNRHRREMIQLLGLQPYSISRLAAIRGLSLPAINKHVRVLEEAGLVRRRKLGRTTFLALDRASIRSLQAWLGRFHAYWGTEKESLENYEPFLATEPMTERERP
jgi:DNA-binding transcriptional ArsR family regulator